MDLKLSKKDYCWHSRLWRQVSRHLTFIGNLVVDLMSLNLSSKMRVGIQRD